MHAASDVVAFWELDLEEKGRLAPVPSLVQPCIRTAGIVDIGIFGEQQDIRKPVEVVDVGPGGKYHRSYCSSPGSTPPTLFSAR